MPNSTEKSLLSPRELAEAIGVSESSIKRWADEGAIQALRTAGGHRRIPIEEAIAFIRVSAMRVTRPELLGIGELDLVAADSLEHGAESEMLHAYLREGKTEEARGLILSLYVGGWSMAQVIDGPIQDSMRRLGELWKHDSNGIFLEHRATDILIQSLNQMRGLLRIPQTSAPTALGAAPTGDPYILPTLGASLVLCEAGFRTTNLGPETPIPTVERASRELSPDLIWLSVSAAQVAERVRAEVQSLLETVALSSGAVAIGGRAVRSLGLARHPSLFVGASMAELEAFVKRYWSSSLPSSTKADAASGLTSA